jgi:hypothetical protein
LLSAPAKEKRVSQTFTHGHALLIGTGGNLPETVKDVERLAELLKDPQRAGYPQEQVRALVGPQASRAGVLKELNDLIARVKADPGATAIVYFSGHGVESLPAHGPPTYALLMGDYDPKQFLNTSLSGQQFTEKIQAIQAQKLLVMLDCCHAQGIPGVKDEPGGPQLQPAPLPRPLEQLALGSGQVILASCQAGQKSYTDGEHSLFTRVLLEALQGRGAAAADGYVRILQVISYLMAEVPKRAATHGAQNPVLKKVLDLGDNFPLCFYAGGAKDVPGLALPPLPAPPPQPASPFLSKKLEAELSSLTAQWELLSGGLDALRQALAIEVNPALRLQFQFQSLGKEAEIAALEQRILATEAALAGSGAAPLGAPAVAGAPVGVPGTQPLPASSLKARQRMDILKQIDLLSQKIDGLNQAAVIENNPLLKQQYQTQSAQAQSERQALEGQLAALDK